MMASAAAGSRPTGGGVGGRVSGASVVDGAELEDGSGPVDDVVESAVAEVQAAKPTTTAKIGTITRSRLLPRVERGFPAQFAPRESVSMSGPPSGCAHCGPAPLGGRITSMRAVGRSGTDDPR